MIISIASQKGGVSKISTAILLAAGLARQYKQTLLVDTDSQVTSSKVLLADYPTVEAEKNNCNYNPRAQAVAGA